MLKDWSNILDFGELSFFKFTFFNHDMRVFSVIVSFKCTLYCHPFSVLIRIDNVLEKRWLVEGGWV